MSDKMKKKLDQELQDVTFHSQQEVRNRIETDTFRTRLSRWLNKEVEVPVVPAATASLLLFASISLYPVFDSNRNPTEPSNAYENELIERGGSVYMKNLYMEVKQHENQDED